MWEGYSCWNCPGRIALHSGRCTWLTCGCFGGLVVGLDIHLAGCCSECQKFWFDDVKHKAELLRDECRLGSWEFLHRPRSQKYFQFPFVGCKVTISESCWRISMYQVLDFFLRVEKQPFLMAISSWLCLSSKTYLTWSIDLVPFFRLCSHSWATRTNVFLIGVGASIAIGIDACIVLPEFP